MSTIAPERPVVASGELDWQLLERQFDDGDYNGGGDDNNNDGGNGGESSGDSPRRKLCLIGGVLGGIAGATISVRLVVEDMLPAHQNIISVPSSKPALEQSYENNLNAKAELAWILGPVVLLAVAGAAIGKIFQNFRSQ